MPNLSPFNAIGMCTKRHCHTTQSVGYYFYETTKFYFQSWENMCAHYGNSERKIQ